MTAPGPTAPTTWRHFNILHRVGVGGMGELFLAEDTRETPPRRVVLKRLHFHLAADAAVVKMFAREAEIIASLSHPNIVRFIGTEREGETFVLVLEWVEGRDLRRILDHARARCELVPEAIAVGIGLDVLAGLDYAHRFRASLPNGKKTSGLIHRDVSPQNIVVATSGVAKIIDFGVAKIRGRNQSTRIGALKGKFAYMSPEQFRGQKLDGRADLYALGVVLYELATLKRPYAGTDGLRLMDAILAGSYVPPAVARPDLSPPFAAFLERAIATDVGVRFQTPTEMAEALVGVFRPRLESATAAAELIETELRPLIAAWVSTAVSESETADNDGRPGTRPSAPFGKSPFDDIPTAGEIDGDEAQNDATLLGDALLKLTDDPNSKDK